MTGAPLLPLELPVVEPVGARTKSDARFYVRREPCWGGALVFTVYDRRKSVPWRTFKGEKPAERRRERLEVDRFRFWCATGKEP
jgi:hypothetical protein